MVVKSIILIRHAEREDRAMEKEGKDWISTAPRPQDPEISEEGKNQAHRVGIALRGKGITRILCSPLIRTVMTADIIATELGLGENTICVERGLVEQARSFRGKDSTEPMPNWNPLLLPIKELAKHSTRIDFSYQTLYDVQHVYDETKLNTIREVHASITDGEEITKDRCKQTLQLILHKPEFAGESVVCVGHGASVKHMSAALEKGLAEEKKTTGERITSCWAEFVPENTENNPDGSGPWVSVAGFWQSGKKEKKKKEVEEKEEDKTKTGIPITAASASAPGAAAAAWLHGRTGSGEHSLADTDDASMLSGVSLIADADDLDDRGDAPPQPTSTHPTQPTPSLASNTNPVPNSNPSLTSATPAAAAAAVSVTNKAAYASAAAKMALQDDETTTPGHTPVGTPVLSRESTRGPSDLSPTELDSTRDQQDNAVALGSEAGLRDPKTRRNKTAVDELADLMDGEVDDGEEAGEDGLGDMASSHSGESADKNKRGVFGSNWHEHVGREHSHSYPTAPLSASAAAAPGKGVEPGIPISTLVRRGSVLRRKPIMSAEKRRRIWGVLRASLTAIAKQRNESIKKNAQYARLCILDAMQGRLKNGLATNYKRSKLIYTIFVIQTSSLLLKTVIWASLLHSLSVFFEPENGCGEYPLLKMLHVGVNLVYIFDILMKLSYEGFKEYFKHDWQQLYVFTVCLNVLDLLVGLDFCTYYANPLRAVPSLLRARSGRRFFAVLKKMIPETTHSLVPIIFFMLIVVIGTVIVYGPQQESDSANSSLNNSHLTTYNWFWLIFTNDSFGRILTEKMQENLSYVMLFFPALYIGQNFLLSLIIGDTYDTFRSYVKKQLKKEKLKEMQGLTKAFAALDDLKQGTISNVVWRECLYALQPDISPEAVALYYELISGGNSNGVSILQFLSLKRVLSFKLTMKPYSTSSSSSLKSAAHPGVSGFPAPDPTKRGSMLGKCGKMAAIDVSGHSTVNDANGLDTPSPKSSPSGVWSIGPNRGPNALSVGSQASSSSSSSSTGSASNRNSASSVSGSVAHRKSDPVSLSKWIRRWYRAITRLYFRIRGDLTVAYIDYRLPIPPSTYYPTYKLLKRADKLSLLTYLGYLDLILFMLGLSNYVMFSIKAAGGANVPEFYFTLTPCMLINTIYLVEFVLRLCAAEGSLSQMHKRGNFESFLFVCGVLGRAAYAIVSTCYHLSDAFRVTLPYTYGRVTFPLSKCLTILKMLRVARIVNLNKTLGHFYVGLFDVAPVLFETMVYAFVIVYAFGMSGNLLFGAFMDDWSSPQLGFVKAQQLFFMSNFLDTVEETMEKVHPIAVLFFVAYLILSLTVSNIALSITIDLHANVLAKKSMKDRDEQKNRIELVFEKMVSQARTRVIFNRQQSNLNFKNITMSRFQSSDVRNFIAGANVNDLRLKEIKECEKYAKPIDIVKHFNDYQRNHKDLNWEVDFLKDVYDSGVNVEKEFAHNEVIFEAGKPAKNLYLLIGGFVNISKQDGPVRGSSTAARAFNKQTVRMYATNFIGSECLQPAGEYTYTCVADKAATCLVFSQDDLAHKLNEELCGSIVRMTFKSDMVLQKEFSELKRRNSFFIPHSPFGEN